MSKLTIAIDGPAGSGKSSVARRVAGLLQYLYLDSGAMYRALALKALKNGIPLNDESLLEKLARETRIELKPPTSEHEAAGAKLRPFSSLSICARKALAYCLRIRSGRTRPPARRVDEGSC